MIQRICFWLLLLAFTSLSRLGYSQSASTTEALFDRVIARDLPATLGTWSARSSVGFTPRSALTSCEVDGKIYALGGYAGNTYFNLLEVFDPATNTWSTPVTTGKFTARRGLTSAVVGGKIYAIGGYDGTRVLNTLEVFDPSNRTWSTPMTNGAMTAREKLCSAVVNGKIYVMGGFDEKVHLNTLEIFDPSKNSWSTPVTTGTFTPRRGLTASVSNGKIYAMGGYNSSFSNPYLNTLEVFDPVFNAWTSPSTTGTFTARGALCSGVINDKIYVMGGVHIVARNYIAVNTLEVFDPVTNEWSSPMTSGTFSARYELTCSTVANKIYVLGGRATDLQFLNTNEVFTSMPSVVINTPAAIACYIRPNPSRGVIKLFGIPPNTTRVSLLNLIGEEIMQFDNRFSLDFTLDCRKLIPGMYFLRISTPTSETFQRIVRE